MKVFTMKGFTIAFFLVCYSSAMAATPTEKASWRESVEFCENLGHDTADIEDIMYGRCRTAIDGKALDWSALRACSNLRDGLIFTEAALKIECVGKIADKRFSQKGALACGNLNPSVFGIRSNSRSGMVIDCLDAIADKDLSDTSVKRCESIEAKSFSMKATAILNCLSDEGSKAKQF